jgi:phage terminase large subunit-like protein
LQTILPTWSTACLDWEERIVAGQSLLPCGPLFPAEAEAALDIFRNLKISDVAGKPTFAEVSRPWVFDLPTALFGSYDPESGRRLIREYFMLVSKKNGKSTLAPGIMLTALIRNWREQGEFYILAPTRELADNSFGPAQAMVRADDALNALIHVAPNQRILTHRKTDAILKVVAADSQAVSGKKTIGLLIEELHEFGKMADAGAMLREARGGLAARPEGFEIRISTQSSKPPRGVFEETLKEFREIRDGSVVAPHKLGLLYEYPKRLLKELAYENPAFWYVTNPNLGLSVDVPYLTDEQASARRKGKADLADFYAKHLNVQISGSLRADGWAGADVWERGIETGLTLDELLRRAEVVTIGIDGGGLDDLLGVGLIGRDKLTKAWMGWGHALISTVGLTRRKANATDYLKFKRQGDLTVFRFADFDAEGDEIDDLPPDLLDDVLEPSGDDIAPDVRYVADLVGRVRDMELLAKVGVDAAGIGGIIDALDNIGVTTEGDQLGSVRQGISLMGAFKTIERKLTDGTFKHGGQELMSWCAGNAKIIPTRTASMIARDEAGYGKVDPLMALFNAASLMSTNPAPVKVGSHYRTHELRVL